MCLIGSDSLRNNSTSSHLSTTFQSNTAFEIRTQSDHQLLLTIDPLVLNYQRKTISLTLQQQMLRPLRLNYPDIMLYLQYHYYFPHLNSIPQISIAFEF